MKKLKHAEEEGDVEWTASKTKAIFDRLDPVCSQKKKYAENFIFWSEI